MRILITEPQHERYGDRFRSTAPDADFLVIDADGRIRCDGVDVDLDAPGAADAQVCFASTDLFDRDPTGGASRSFFTWVVKHQEPLEWLHIAAAGVDAPIFGMLLDAGIRLTTSHHTGIPISEWVLAQVLRARIPLDAMAEDRAARRWRSQEWDEVASSRWLVIGLGTIGTEVAQRARAFGAHVTGVRRRPRGDEPVDAMISPDAVADHLGDHDVVVLCTPATAETEGMVDAAFLARMAPGSLLVNVGRGTLIDQDALRASLDRGRPARAILDVADPEPLPDDHWIWDDERIVFTTHTSAGGRQRYDRAADIFAANLARWVTGRPLAGEVTAADRR